MTGASGKLVKQSVCKENMTWSHHTAGWKHPYSLTAVPVWRGCGQPRISSFRLAAGRFCQKVGTWAKLHIRPPSRSHTPLYRQHDHAVTRAKSLTGFPPTNTADGSQKRCCQGLNPGFCRGEQLLSSLNHPHGKSLNKSINKSVVTHWNKRIALFLPYLIRLNLNHTSDLSVQRQGLQRSVILYDVIL